MNAPKKSLVIMVWIFCVPIEGEHVGSHEGREGVEHFHNEWVLQFHDDSEDPHHFARKHGYHYEGKVLGFESLHRFSQKERPHREKREAVDFTYNLKENSKVLWAEQQYNKVRVKRGSLPQDRFNDVMWPNQWYLGIEKHVKEAPRFQKDPLLNLNVLGAYDLGFTGKSVKITVLDDGIEGNHKDLALNYDPDLSYDINDDDPDPTPRYTIAENDHGTRCAGEIAMVSNNSLCGVGVAYNSRIGAIRMLDGPINDRVEGSGIAVKSQTADIVCAAWGPRDDGMTVEGPGKLASQAIQEGILKGRNGLGTIFVWASGNGGAYGDNCNCDGYSSNIHTISIGSSSEHGSFPYYGEECSSVMAVTQSSGANSERRITTTGLNDTCITSNTGTSAAMPLAAGILALVLEANPRLTWRDVQHLVVWASNPQHLGQAEDWVGNAAGLRFSNKFGFGLMDATRMVRAAQDWTTVPDKLTCVVKNRPLKATLFDRDQEGEVTFHTDDCPSGEKILYLEHVVALVTIQATFRGAVQVHLTSPHGTASQLLSSRFQDDSKLGFISWPLVTTQLWGESSQGEWKLTVSMDKDLLQSHPLNGSLSEFELHLHGTSRVPHHMTLDFDRHWANKPIMM